MSVVTILFLVFASMMNIQWNNVTVCIVLWIIAILTSAVFATLVAFIEWKCALISLAVTTVTTVMVILLAFNLPPLNTKGFIFFGTISGLLTVLDIVADIWNLLTGGKITVLCILRAV
ncbi:unnamed protein product, partial [Trichobilharzia szidati]